MHVTSRQFGGMERPWRTRNQHLDHVTVLDCASKVTVHFPLLQVRVVDDYRTDAHVARIADSFLVPAVRFGEVNRVEIVRAGSVEEIVGAEDEELVVHV